MRKLLFPLAAAAALALVPAAPSQAKASWLSNALHAYAQPGYGYGYGAAPWFGGAAYVNPAFNPYGAGYSPWFAGHTNPGFINPGYGYSPGGFGYQQPYVQPYVGYGAGYRPWYWGGHHDRDGWRGGYRR